jgi:N-acetylneuraminate synthase
MKSRPIVRIIAEAGVNHNGDIGLALELVAAAADAGADDVKFQTFDSEALVSPQTPLAAYQVASGVDTRSQRDMLSKLQLSREDHERLIVECGQRGIRFLSSAFDHSSLAMLCDDLAQTTIKFGSGELTNAPLLLDAASRGVDMILSTGMADMNDVEQALGVISYGQLAGSPDNGSSLPPPGKTAFNAARTSEAGIAGLRERLTLLHCVSTYPAPDDSLNLLALDSMRAAFDLPVGYSDHSLGTRACIAAVSRGAVCIEKHLTLDRNLSGPDHNASIEPDGFRQLVSDVRATEAMMGSGEKLPVVAELDTASVARKTIVATRSINAGEPFTENNLGIRRAGTGLNPIEYWSLLGRPALRAFRPDEIIE